MTDDLTRRLACLDACAVSDAMDALGLDGVIVGLSPVSTATRIAGRAITVKLGPADGRPAGSHLGTAAVDRGGAGDVIVVEHGRADVAGWGGILSLAARTKLIEGIIVDGACRDIDEARDMGLPVYARATTPRTARGRIVEYCCGEPITVAGIAVASGDYVIADASGIVAVPRANAEAIVAVAERIVRKEKLMADQVRAGHPAAAVMGRDYEEMLNDGAAA